jgi:hypothetical protein
MCQVFFIKPEYKSHHVNRSGHHAHTSFLWMSVITMITRYEHCLELACSIFGLFLSSLLWPFCWSFWHASVPTNSKGCWTFHLAQMILLFTVGTPSWSEASDKPESLSPYPLHFLQEKMQLHGFSELYVFIFQPGSCFVEYIKATSTLVSTLQQKKLMERLERLLDFVNLFCKCFRFVEISYWLEISHDFISERVIYESVRCVLIRMSIQTTFM